MQADQHPVRGRVVLADDDVLLREGLASLCERVGYEVAGQAGDAAGLMELVETELPDIAIVDIRMPPTQSTEGLKAASTIRERYPSVGILVLSAFVEVEDALELLAGGAPSATCSRAGSPSSTSSWRPSTASAGVGRWSIRRWCRSWWPRSVVTTRCRCSAIASGRFSA